MRKFAEITDGLVGQPMFHLLAKAQEMEKAGREIIHFEIGDPDFDSPDHVKEAAKKAIDENLTHYTHSMGMLECREAVADYVEHNWGFRPSINQILICPANAVIDFVTRCVVNPGEEVIHPDPGFPTYSSVIAYNKMISVGVGLNEKNDFRMNPDDVSRKISEKTRLLIINTPQNPTGSVMTKEEVLEIAKIAELNDIFLLSDEVYSAITYGKTHYSPTIRDQCRERSILLGGLSKIYSMSGWRIGYAVGPEKLIEKMGLLLQTIISCMPAFVQLGGKAALSGDQTYLDERFETLKHRRNALIKGLNNLPGMNCIMPEGSFYAFPNIDGTGMTSEEYSLKLLHDSGVCVLPGNCFGNFGEGFVRLSYASTSLTVIKSALEKMRKFHTKSVQSKS